MLRNNMKQLIGITMGDPKGIGPEVVAKAWKALSFEERDDLLIYGDRAVLTAAEELAKTEINHKQIVLTSSTSCSIQKMDDTEAARLAVSALDAAVTDVSSKKISAIVTAPVNKLRMRLAKPMFIGHTEYLAKAARVKAPIMMFVSTVGSEVNLLRQQRLCFSLVTTHISIKEISGLIKTSRIFDTIIKTNEALCAYFDSANARIAVMSLNPHSGEGGLLGLEEQTAISPAIKKALSKGINCVGPISADYIFNNLEDFDYDAVVAMYHDQALTPIKLLCQNTCVHMTLGLPYVRTSPLHGTAEDIAWLGNANEASMLAAIKLTRKIIDKKIVSRN